VAAIGARFTRSLRSLGCGGAFGGLAVALLAYGICGCLQQGFDLLHAAIIPPAILALLLVMASQNWCVFYEDRRDAALSARPAFVVLTAGILSLFTVHALRNSLLLQLIWAGAGSLAILLCIHPIQRAIELNRSAAIGAAVGICKVLLPLSFIVLFLPIGIARCKAAATASGDSENFAQRPFVANLIGLFADIGILPLMTLINGARVTHAPRPPDPFDHLLQPRGGQSMTGKTPALKTDSVVLVLVAAVHVLGIIVLAKG
jgi:hypothetical protein